MFCLPQWCHQAPYLAHHCRAWSHLKFGEEEEIWLKFKLSYIFYIQSSRLLLVMLFVYGYECPPFACHFKATLANHKEIINCNFNWNYYHFSIISHTYTHTHTHTHTPYVRVCVCVCVWVWEKWFYIYIFLKIVNKRNSIITYFLVRSFFISKKFVFYFLN